MVFSEYQSAWLLELSVELSAKKETKNIRDNNRKIVKLEYQLSLIKGLISYTPPVVTLTHLWWFNDGILLIARVN